MIKYQDISLGDYAELEHQITAKDIEQFVVLTGDDNKLHVDANFAANTSFKKPVAHGMLGASFISTIIGTKLPGDGALWMSQTIDFLLPVREGDILKVSAKVIGKEDRTKVISLDTNITNQYRQCVTKGVAKVKVLELVSSVDSLNESEPKGKVALVVGASGGIGSASAIALAKAGFIVATHYHKNENMARKIVEDIKSAGGVAMAFGCDITDYKATMEMGGEIEKRLGNITVAVNCTTVKIGAIKFSDLHWNDFETHINSQVKGAFNLVSSIYEPMMTKKYGKIIFIDTQYVDDPAANLTPYITAKSALRGLGRSLAREFGPKGIRVNIISPGMIETEQIADVPERIQLTTAANTPLRRLGKAQDIAQAVVFLASSQSDFLCGEVIRINGGQVMI